MANFTTVDDKRIFQLQPESAPSLDMSLPIDRNGNIGAKRITLLELLNLLSSDGTKQDANAGTTNPDNTFGEIGDFYFKIPEDGSSLTMFKKVTSNSWSTVFNLPIGGGDNKKVYIYNEGVSSEGILDISIETDIPENAAITIYESGVMVPATYDENSKIIYGLSGNYPVKIVMI